MAHEFHLPDVGEGLTEAVVISWYVEVGEVVSMDAALVEVETDKAVTAIPSPFTGTVRDVRVGPGDIVTVGDVLVVFDGALFTRVLRGWSVLFPAFDLEPDLGGHAVLVCLLLAVVPYVAATLWPTWRSAVIDPDTVIRS